MSLEEEFNDLGYQTFDCARLLEDIRNIPILGCGARRRISALMISQQRTKEEIDLCLSTPSRYPPPPLPIDKCKYPNCEPIIDAKTYPWLPPCAHEPESTWEPPVGPALFPLQCPAGYEEVPSLPPPFCPPGARVIGTEPMFNPLTDWIKRFLDLLERSRPPWPGPGRSSIDLGGKISRAPAEPPSRYPIKGCPFPRPGNARYIQRQLRWLDKVLSAAEKQIPTDFHSFALVLARFLIALEAMTIVRLTRKFRVAILAMGARLRALIDRVYPDGPPIEVQCFGQSIPTEPALAN